MSSKNLEKEGAPSRGTAERLLLLLKTEGPHTGTELGTVLGITHEATRQQLAKLAAEGLVESTTEVRGVGRPSHVWRLTEAGHQRFPDAHAALSVQLLRTIQNELGAEALECLIAAREAETRTAYSTEIGDSRNLEERVKALATIRSREGYMAEWHAEGDGYLLLENHCPICTAATACRGFCRAELNVFQSVLGEEAVVTRIEHIPAGARRCAYRIQPAKHMPASEEASL